MTLTPCIYLASLSLVGLSLVKQKLNCEGDLVEGGKHDYFCKCVRLIELLVMKKMVSWGSV